MTEPGEIFQTPKPVADGIDLTRDQAQAEQREEAAAARAAGPPPPAPGDGEAPAPPVVRPAQLLAVIPKANAGIAWAAKRRKKVVPPIGDEEAHLWAQVTAPCLSQIAGPVASVPWLGPLLQWGACLGMTVIVFGPPLAQLMAPEEKKKDGDGSTANPKAADVVSVR